MINLPKLKNQFIEIFFLGDFKHDGSNLVSKLEPFKVGKCVHPGKNSGSWFRRRRKRLFLILAWFAWLTMTIKFNGVSYFGYRVFHVLSYATTQPIWDKQIDDNFTDIPFFVTSKRREVVNG